MLKIHQPYKYKSKYILALSSTGVLLLGSLWFGCRLWELSSGAKQLLATNSASAAGDWRTIHDIENMQEMTQQICSNTDESDTATLKDTRDPNSYTVVKLKDGNCWMQENLRLKLTSGTEIEGSTKDGAAYNWTVPTDANNKNMSATTQAYSTSGPWTNDNTVVMSRAGSGTNGTYYTWCAATAGTCSNATADDAVAVASICPRAWHLPTGGGIRDNGTGELGLLLNKVGYPSVTQTPYLFPTAGYVASDGSLYAVGSDGCYWSSTGYSGSFTYGMHFNDGDYYMPGTGAYDRENGYSVRCVALGGLDKVEKPPVWQETADTGINVTVPKVLTLDVSDGVNTTADAYNVVKGEIVAIVTSNNIDYEVLLSSEQPSLIGQKDSSNYIAPVSTSNPVQPGTSAWGILNTSNLYDPITTTPTEFHNTSVKNGTSTSHTYGVGISISPTLPADTYSTTVTVTASSK